MVPERLHVSDAAIFSIKYVSIFIKFKSIPVLFFSLVYNVKKCGALIWISTIHHHAHIFFIEVSEFLVYYFILKRMRGTTPDMLQSHLDEYCWRIEIKKVSDLLI